VEGDKMAEEKKLFPSEPMNKILDNKKRDDIQENQGEKEHCEPQMIDRISEKDGKSERNRVNQEIVYGSSPSSC
jgi:hypothetical protein